MDAKVEGTSEEGEKGKKEFRSFYDVVRKMMLAGIGAVALSHDEIEEFIDKLVERGEIARKDREELFNEMRERHRQFHEDPEGHARRRVNAMMERFSIPSKDDFDQLNQKLARLEKKIDDLNRAKNKP